MLRAALEGGCKGVHPGTEEDFPPFGRACVDKLNWPDATVPVPSKDCSAFLLACK